MKITHIQDDGKKFIIHGETGLYGKLADVFENLGMGISVTKSDMAAANILYTENNRDIVLRILRERTEGSMSQEG